MYGSAKITDIRIVVRPDSDPDTSYLEQEEWEDRLKQYRDGQFNFVGVQLEAEVHIPYGKDHITHIIASPGLWGIESDSGEDYYRSTAEDEADVLGDMLHALHVAIRKTELQTKAKEAEIIYR